MQYLEISKGSELNANAYRLISYSLVAAMMACAALTIVSLVSRFDPAWQPSYLVFLCFVVALDRLYTHRFSRDWMSMSKEWLVRNGAQAVAIVVLTKVTIGLSHGWNAFFAEISNWHQDFAIRFFNGEMLFALVMVAITWLLSGDFANLLEEIGPDQILSAQLELARFDPEKAVPPRRRLVSLFFAMGAVLVVLTAIGRLDLRAMIYQNNYSSFFVEIPALAAGGASTMLYFMLGLALLSQTQFISMQVRWNIQKIPVNGKLAKQWAGYSLLFLTIVMLLVSLLPTSYSIQPLRMLAYLLDMAFFAYLSIGQLLLGFFVYLLALLYKLLGKEAPASDPPAAPATPPPPLEAGVADGMAWWEVAKSLIFWAIFLSVLFFAARQYLRQHREILDGLRKLSAWHFLAGVWAWLQSLWTQAKSGIASVTQAVRARASQSAAGQRFENGWINLRGLDPRQRIYFYYLALVRRGGEKGLPRSRSQTPNEYATALQAALPDADEDIRALTQAFIAARYSRRPVEAEQAQQAGSVWERIRKLLRGKLGR